MGQEVMTLISINPRTKKNSYQVTEKLASILQLDVIEDVKHETDGLRRVHGALPVWIYFEDGGLHFFDFDHHFGGSCVAGSVKEV